MDLSRAYLTELVRTNELCHPNWFEPEPQQAIVGILLNLSSISIVQAYQLIEPFIRYRNDDDFYEELQLTLVFVDNTNNTTIRVQIDGTGTFDENNIYIHELYIEFYEGFEDKINPNTIYYHIVRCFKLQRYSTMSSETLPVMFEDESFMNDHYYNDMCNGQYYNLKNNIDKSEISKIVSSNKKILSQMFNSISIKKYTNIIEKIEELNKVSNDDESVLPKYKILINAACLELYKYK